MKRAHTSSCDNLPPPKKQKLTNIYTPEDRISSNLFYLVKMIGCNVEYNLFANIKQVAAYVKKPDSDNCEGLIIPGVTCTAADNTLILKTQKVSCHTIQDIVLAELDLSCEPNELKIFGTSVEEGGIYPIGVQIEACSTTGLPLTFRRSHPKAQCAYRNTLAGKDAYALNLTNNSPTPGLSMNTTKNFIATMQSKKKFEVKLNMLKMLTNPCLSPNCIQLNVEPSPTTEFGFFKPNSKLGNLFKKCVYYSTHIFFCLVTKKALLKIAKLICKEISYTEVTRLISEAFISNKSLYEQCVTSVLVYVPLDKNHQVCLLVDKKSLEKLPKIS